MLTNAEVNKQFQLLTITAQNTLYGCKRCGACVPYEGKYKHASFHQLIDGMDEVINSATAEFQDEIPF